VTKFIFRYRWWIIIASWLIALGLGVLIPKTQIDPEVEAMVPKNMESRINTDRIEDLFGGSDLILLLIQSDDVIQKSTLERVEALSEGFEQIPLIERTLSLFTMKEIRGENGMMLVDPAIPYLPESVVEIKALKKKLLDNELINGVVLSDDFHYTAIIGTIQKEVDNEALLYSVDSLIKQHPGPEKTYLGGFPVVNQSITDNIGKDLIYLLPLALFLMIAMLRISFRDFRGVYLPFSIVLMSILVSMGLMPLFGWKIAIVTVLLPVMLIAIANNYGIHMVNRYQEILKRDPDAEPRKILGELQNKLTWPVILTALTTIAGILGLLTHIIVPAKQVGVLASIGIAWALTLSLIYLPANLAVAKKSVRSKTKKRSSAGRSERFLIHLGERITRHPKRVLWIGLAVTLVTGAGIIKLKVEGNTVKFFSRHDPVRVSSDLIDHYFGGSQTLSILFTGDCKDPELLSRIDHYEQQLKNEEGVGQVMSMASVIHLISKALNDPGDPGYDQIPKTRNAIAQYLELYSMSGDPSDFEQLVDFNYEHTQMIIRVNKASSSTILHLVKKIRVMIAGDPNAEMIGGIGLISAELTDSLIRGQRNSLIFALVIVTLLVGLIFRSFQAGLLSLIPLGMATLILFGLMGWLGIRLDAATTLLSSVMIGVGVDYTIHYLWRHRDEIRSGKTHPEAIVHTLPTTGKGIAFNALSVMVGFSVLIFSAFNPIRFFGFLVVISILACFAGAMLIIPAACQIWKPRFFEHQKKQ